MANECVHVHDRVRFSARAYREKEATTEKTLLLIWWKMARRA
ncbi:MAG TPA: hypothetical protein VFB60_09925 [Ktedonobacteraceae bacterium]|nr:hypothetical protein [Ktedonobacteraceae bacterium]